MLPRGWNLAKLRLPRHSGRSAGTQTPELTGYPDRKDGAPLLPVDPPLAVPGTEWTGNTPMERWLHGSGVGDGARTSRPSLRG